MFWGKEGLLSFFDGLVWGVGVFERWFIWVVGGDWALMEAGFLRLNDWTKAIGIKSL